MFQENILPTLQHQHPDMVTQDGVNPCLHVVLANFWAYNPRVAAEIETEQFVIVRCPVYSAHCRLRLQFLADRKGIQFGLLEFKVHWLQEIPGYFSYSCCSVEPVEKLLCEKNRSCFFPAVMPEPFDHAGIFLCIELLPHSRFFRYLH